VHARTIINADDETVVSVIERNCGDPGCEDTRTIVLIMHPGRPSEAVTIGKPLEQITLPDISNALAGLVAQTGSSELPPKPN
jgi:hypothetical protein